jgi:hypothetical protein
MAECELSQLTRISSNPSTDLGIAVRIVRIHVKERAVASIRVMTRTVSRLTQYNYDCSR